MKTVTSIHRIWFVTPVYLDVMSFRMLRERLIEKLRQNGSPHAGAELRFMIIDDTAGGDPEIAQVRSMQDVTVVTPPFNLGHQRAIVYALRKLSDSLEDDDVVVTLDADGEDRPEDLPRLLSSLLTDGSGTRSIALAQRTKRRESLSFKVMYFFYKKFFRSLTGKLICSGNYAAYWGWTVKNLLPHPHFDLCYSSSFVSLNLPISYVPCERGVRYAGHSRMNLFKLIMHGLRMLMPLTDRIAVRALIGFSISFTMSVSATLAVAGAKYIGGYGIPGWTLLVMSAATLLLFIALGNFIILFTVFAQSQSLSLRGIDHSRQPQENSHPNAA